MSVGCLSCCGISVDVAEPVARVTPDLSVTKVTESVQSKFERSQTELRPQPVVAFQNQAAPSVTFKQKVLNWFAKLCSK